MNEPVKHVYLIDGSTVLSSTEVTWDEGGVKVVEHEEGYNRIHQIPWHSVMQIVWQVPRE